MRKLRKVVLTRGIANEMERGLFGFQQAVNLALEKFAKEDWGTVCEEDAEMNQIALAEHEQILGAYESPLGEIWVASNFYPKDYYKEVFGETVQEDETFIEVTTVLFPSEY